MADLVWLHEGALRLTHPVFAASGPDATAIFIWDRDRLAASHVGIKRQLFIYETLAEMSESRSLDIHEGRAEEVLPRLAAQAGAGRVLVPSSPDPALRAEIGAIRRATLDLEIVEIEETPFVTLAKKTDLGRFFRYWNKARKSALRPQGI
ncbi:MAG: deoxyribodipyrimidine photo-lyase [SAR116 cluster bacterium]|nr:deoxyribodipyrimidine photo-lyase [SAR116 cluster bacterium]